MINRAVSTVSREVAANGGRDDYRAWRAHRRAGGQARRPKAPKLVSRLAEVVTEWLEEWWSPEEIACRLRFEFPDDPMMWVSHETIYQSLFVQGRGELRRELTVACAPGELSAAPAAGSSAEAHPGHGDDLRAPSRGRGPGRARATGRAISSSARDDRSAVGTLVERTTRYVMLLHLPDGREAEKVNAAMKEAIADLPEQLRRTITWDQGREMSSHAQFTIDTGIQMYFCDPHSPWQRRLQREHQRPAAPVHAQGHRPVGPHRRGPGPDRHGVSTTVPARPSDS